MKKFHKWSTKHFNFSMEIMHGLIFGYAKECSEHFFALGMVVFSIEYTK